MIGTILSTRTGRIFHLPRPGRLLQYIRSRLYRPELSSESVSEILGQYDLSLVNPPENLPFGWRNDNLVVATPAGKKVLKRYREQWQEPALLHEHSILRRLAAADFPAPRLVSTGEDRTFVKYDGRYFALFELLSGKNYAATFLTRRRRTQLVARAGRTLGRLHRELDGFVPEGEHHLGYTSYAGDRRRDLTWHLEQLEVLPGQSAELVECRDQEAARWLCERSTEIGARLRALAGVLEEAPLRRLVIHGDYGIHNLHYHRDGTVTVHDFELARLEWRVVDLVGAFRRLDEASRRVFVAAYQAEFPLSTDEWRLFPQVWEYYRLRGAVQYWHNYFDLGGGDRLTGARKRMKQADWPVENKSKIWQLKAAAAGQDLGLKKPARVMMVVRLFYPWIGGTERQAHKLARKLVEQQQAVELVTGWWFRGTARRESIDGIPLYRNFTLWHFLDIKGLRKFGGYLYILSLILYLWRRRADYDLIHVHGLNYHTFAAVIAGRLTGRKVLVKLANSGRASDINKMRNDKQLALARYMLSTALQCNRFVALNEKVVKELRAVGVPPEKIVELGNGVEVDDNMCRVTYALHEPARILYVGRLHKQKGLDTLLHAFQRLRFRRSDSSMHLRLVGDGPLREKLIALAEQLKISPWVEFQGESDQVRAELHEADIFVLPSRAEGLSNALLEAMSCGLPVVVSDIPGNRDVIDDGENGLRFGLDDPEALAVRLDRLLAREMLRRRLGQAGFRTVQREYSLDHIAECYTALYEELMR